MKCFLFNALKYSEILTIEPYFLLKELFLYLKNNQRFKYRKTWVKVMNKAKTYKFSLRNISVTQIVLEISCYESFDYIFLLKAVLFFIFFRVLQLFVQFRITCEMSEEKLALFSGENIICSQTEGKNFLQLIRSQRSFTTGSFLERF